MVSAPNPIITSHSAAIDPRSFDPVVGSNVPPDAGFVVVGLTAVTVRGHRASEVYS
jgi:hypothetical protein